MRQATQVVRQGLANEIRRWVLGLTDMQVDRREIPVGRNTFEQLVELLEGVGLQAVEIGIQFYKEAACDQGRSFSGWKLDRSGIIKGRRLADQAK